MKKYKKEDLQKLKWCIRKLDLIYPVIIICPGEGETEGYLNFLVIGCDKNMKPVEIIKSVHAFQFDHLLDPIKTDIKFHMVGEGIFQIWAKDHKIKFGLLSECLDIQLIPADNRH